MVKTGVADYNATRQLQKGQILMKKVSTSAWPLPKAKPSQVGLCATRLQRVDAYLDRLMAARTLAGAITLIARRGRLAHLRCHGMMDVENRVAMREDAIFRIYSMTKPIICVATLMLVEDGTVTLHDPVSRYLPALADLRVATTGPDGTQQLVNLQRPITIHDLLTHTSGLTYPFNNCFNYPSGPAIFLAALAEIPLATQPGEKWQYSCANDVLGCLIEAVTGQRLDKFLDERIFRPLGMCDTAFTVPKSKRNRFTTLYQHDDQVQIVRRETEDHPYLGQPVFLSGGSGLVGTMADYLRFCLMLLRNGELDGVRLLSRKTVDLMRVDHLPPGQPAIAPFKIAYGYGVSVVRSLAEKQSICSVGEFGWGGAAGTNAWIDPTEEMVSMVMYQLCPTKGPYIDHQVKTLLTQAIAD